MANRTKWHEIEFCIGDIIAVHQKIQEGEKTRTVIFEGIVIKIKGRGISKTFTVRKIAADKIGVEKTFPLALPTITKLEVTKKAKKRAKRAKLYYLREKNKLIS